MLESYHDLALYLRVMGYLFLVYSMASMAIQRWSSDRRAAIIHAIFAFFFLGLASARIIPLVFDTAQYQHFVEDFTDFIITPILLIGVGGMWRYLINQSRDKVKNLERQIKNGNQKNHLAEVRR